MEISNTMDTKDEYLETGRQFKFMLELRINDTFIKTDDLIEFIRYRLNLKHAVKLEKIYLLEDSDHVQKLPKNEVT